MTVPHHIQYKLDQSTVRVSCMHGGSPSEPINKHIHNFITSFSVSDRFENTYTLAFQKSWTLCSLYWLFRKGHNVQFNKKRKK